jgi:hypothetical protein
VKIPFMFTGGERHGMGRFEYSNGNLYVGSWEHGASPHCLCVYVCVCVCVCVQVYVCKPQLPVVQILHFLKCIFFTTNRLVG